MEMSCQLHVTEFFTLGERTPGTHSIGREVGPRAGLNTAINWISLLVSHYSAWARFYRTVRYRHLLDVCFK